MTTTQGASGDRFGRVEVRGIDYIPESERHGTARELFVVWAASNTAYFYILLGGGLSRLGLNVWQASCVVLAGNLFWGLTGLISVSGPAAGTPANIVTRAMFGVRANRLNVALCNWSTAVAFEAINLSVGGLATFSLLQQLGVPVTGETRAIVILGIAVVTFAISIYGHATIVKLSGPFTLVLMSSIALLAVFIAPHVVLHVDPAHALHGAALWGAALAGLTIIASGPLSWGSAADYARYLPSATPPLAVASWTAIGGFLPCAVLGLIGALAATAVDMTDPQISFAGILPHWFYLVFLCIIVLGSITNNVLTAYSSGLSLQAMGIKARRSVTVLFDGIVGLSVTVYALFVTNFLDALNNILDLSVAVVGPNLAVYATDIVLRRNRYDGRALSDESSASPHWCTNGICWPGVVAQLGGTVAALLCVNTPTLMGPVARAFGGTDLSSLSGPITASALYLVFKRHHR